MNSSRKQYLVAMTEAETYSIWIDARSDDEAKQLAVQNWQETGFTDWNFEGAETGPLDILDERESQK